MTPEQYNRAIEINARLNKLKAISRDAQRHNAKPHIALSILYGSEDGRVSAHYDNTINDILERHAKQIIDEVDAEIASLEKEIETL